MPHLHKTTSYEDIPDANPFNEGQDKAYGDLLLEAHNNMKWWRNVAGIGSLALFAVCIGLFLYALNLQKIVPVLVNVMPTGEAAYLGEVKQRGALDAPEGAVIFQVRKFITNLRSISSDKQVLYNNIEDCYAMATSACSQVLTRRLREKNPFEVVGKIRAQVRIESIIKTTEHTYQADWIETISDSSSSEKNVRMRALVTMKILPVDEKTIKVNPLGIYIDAYEITEL